MKHGAYKVKNISICCRKREDYFNQSLFDFFLELFVDLSEENPEWFSWHNPYRIALRVKFTLDKLLGEVKYFMENNVVEALGVLKEEANMNPERDWNHKYPLKTWQVKVDLDHPKEWYHECLDYLNNWVVHGRIIPRRKGIATQLSREGNVFKIESYLCQRDLEKEESESESENDSDSDDEDNDINTDEEGYFDVEDDSTSDAEGEENVDDF